MSRSPRLRSIGRFQPVHRGHASLLSSAEEWEKECAEHALRIAIGSINKPQNLANPWDAEREKMLNLSLENLVSMQRLLVYPTRSAQMGKSASLTMAHLAF